MKPVRLEQLPQYLQAYIVRQDMAAYTAIDHACWRYIMRLNQTFFAEHAHPAYIQGLEATGITAEQIPDIQTMDERLQKLGWRAVAVSGFIPPTVFMEFQSLRILPIACDMRQRNHLTYTPAPDIVHEAAGHAPFLGDDAYARYLRRYGECSRKALYSSHDTAIYYAIRALSDIKEDPASTPEDIRAAQNTLDEAVNASDVVSEAAQLARLFWWTVEYGLVGPLDKPKIYGAGLLSSVGESASCLKPGVRKVPFSLDCIDQGYDITKPQPQLFVTPDFETLAAELEIFAQGMAYQQGGYTSLVRASAMNTPCTVVLETGLQVSGRLDTVIDTEIHAAAYLQFKGPCQLSYDYIELAGHGVNHHAEGFGMPLGTVMPYKKPAWQLTTDEWHELGFKGSEMGQLMFHSGVTVEGRISQSLVRMGRPVLLTLTDCSVRLGETVLFEPDWGVYDLALGEEVVSVFGGPADRERYLGATGELHPPKRQQKSNYVPEDESLIRLYKEVRRIRQSGEETAHTHIRVETVVETLKTEFTDDWLLRMELLEWANVCKSSPHWKKALIDDVKRIAQQHLDFDEAIHRGLSLLNLH